MKKDDIDLMLEDSFKTLLLNYPFEKITIKMITDKAGLIRPTFYNHFADKYEVVEKICYKEIFQGCELLIESRMLEEAIFFMFSKIENNKEFYIKANKITGQNSFEEILNNNIKALCKNFFYSYKNSKEYKEVGILSVDNISRYFANGLTFIIKTWIDEGIKISARELSNQYSVLMSNSMENIIKQLTL